MLPGFRRTFRICVTRSVCECWHFCVFEIICKLLQPLWEIAQSISQCKIVSLLLLMFFFFIFGGLALSPDPTGTGRKPERRCRPACSSTSGATRTGRSPSRLSAHDGPWLWQGVRGSGWFPATTCSPLQLPGPPGVFARVGQTALDNGALSSTGQPPGRHHRRRHNGDGGGTITTQHGDQCGVCNLRPMEQGQTVNEDLDATLVQPVRSHDVHVLDPDVGRDPSTPFATHSCCCGLHCEPATPEHPRHSACCAVVATRIEWTATPANTAGRGVEGAHKRRRSRVRKTCASSVVCLAVGQQMKGVLARCPL